MRSAGKRPEGGSIIASGKSRELKGAEAMRSGKSVLDLVRERKLLSEEQILELMDVKALTGQR